MSEGVPIVEQIRCVEREISMRERVYGRRCDEGKMTRKSADREITSMKAVLATLQRIGAEQGQLL